MADGKTVALKWYVECDGVDLSRWFRDIHVNSSDDEVDASGFNEDGSDDIIPGKRAKSATGQLMMSRVANGPHQVLFPLHDGRLEFDLVLRSDSSQPVSATNGEWRGSVTMPTWSEGATRGELEVMDVTFNSVASDPLTYYAT